MDPMTAYKRVEVQPHSFLKILHTDEWSALSPGCFTAGEKEPFAVHWVRPRTSLGVLEKTPLTSL